MAGLLTCPCCWCLPNPVLSEKVAFVVQQHNCKNAIRTYSCGYSSGFTPDSLFNPVHEKWTFEPKFGGEYRELFLEMAVIVDRIWDLLIMGEGGSWKGEEGSRESGTGVMRFPNRIKLRRPLRPLREVGRVCCRFLSVVEFWLLNATKSALRINKDCALTGIMWPYPRMWKNFERT